MTEAEAKLQLRRIEQFNVVNEINRFKFEWLEPAITKGLRELRDRLRAESVNGRIVKVRVSYEVVS